VSVNLGCILVEGCLETIDHSLSNTAFGGSLFFSSYLFKEEAGGRTRSLGETINIRFDLGP
jgi:hypothetical protein